MPEIIGWGSALILLPAFATQTYRQWKNRHEPVNSSALWFFVLVLIGTGGQVAYSWMVRNWVYLALNSALVVNNGIGLGIAVRRRLGTGSPEARNSHLEEGDNPRASAGSPASSPEANQPGLRGQMTMNSGNDADRTDENDDSGDDRGSSRRQEDHPEVVSTSDPVVARGRGAGEGSEVRPDETIVAETSRVTRTVPGYVSQSSPFVPAEQAGSQAKPKGKADKGGQGRQQGHPEDGQDDQKDPDDDQHHDGRGDQPAHSGRPGWMSYVVTGVVALVCGVGGAWAFSYFDSSKDKDQSQQSKQGGGGSSKKGDSSKEKAKGKGGGGSGSSASDSGSEIPGFTSAEDANTLKMQIEHVSSRLDTLQQRMDSMGNSRGETPPDVGTLRIKLGELSRSVDAVAGLPSRSQQMENRLDRMQEDIKGLRDQISAARERGGSLADTPNINAIDHRVDAIAGPPPAPPSLIIPDDPSSPDAAMAEGIALFKRGQYPQADDIFRKLRMTRPQDARVWYYSALAHGFNSGQWDGDTRDFVVQGADRERAGMPSASQIDSAFSGLSPAQGKDWLSSYRSKLVKR